jgi:hypothetical protein
MVGVSQKMSQGSTAKGSGGKRKGSGGPKQINSVTKGKIDRASAGSNKIFTYFPVQQKLSTSPTENGTVLLAIERSDDTEYISKEEQYIIDTVIKLSIAFAEDQSSQNILQHVAYNLNRFTELGLSRMGIDMDGNCLFRVFSQHMYNTPERHDDARKLCMY